uniref:Fmn-dependent dehydrogenase family protein n=1 Tax=Colletotrichum fructicola (strain Nara gc5) TaxID=1213859 RepID=L2FS58_COLFN
MANRGKTLDEKVFSIKDLKEEASKKLPRAYKEFFNEGAMDMITVQDNEDAYNRYKIRPRVLRDVSNIDTSTTIFGVKVALPFGFSPAATHKLAHPEGASCRCGWHPDGTLCICHFILKNRDITRQILQRAEQAGYKAVMMTVDAPMLGRRLNEYRNAFGLPEGMGYPNIAPGMDMRNLVDQGLDLTYEDGMNWEQALSWIRENTKLDVWLKGVYTADDVALAIEHGIDGVLISNHGGRQLDGVPATLDALRECAPIAKGKIKIAVDGGIRRGTDIFKALALGADFCFAGRVPIWGLAYNGSEGVQLAVNLLHDELRLAMCLAGCKTVKDINKGHLSLLQANGVLAKL